MELAVRLRAEASGGASERYVQNINLLVQRNIIASREVDAWHAGRSLRNSASHPGEPFVIDPQIALGMLGLTAERILHLFPTPPSPSRKD